MLEAELAHQRGGPENPLRDADVRAKFRANARLAIGEDDVTRLEPREVLQSARVPAAIVHDDQLKPPIAGLRQQ